MVPGYVDIAYVFVVERSLLENADKSKAVFLHWFAGNDYNVGHTGRMIF